MATEVFIPKLGANMLQGKIESWYVDEGEEVDIGEPLFDLVTDKATVVVEAEARGIVRKILVAEDTTVPIVTTVAIIGDEEEDITPVLKEIEEREKRKLEEAAIDAESEKLTKKEPSGEIKAEVKKEKTSPVVVHAAMTIPKSGRIKASPKARKMAAENNVELSSVTSTGKDGVITFEDVEEFIRLYKGKKNILIMGAGEYSRVILEIFQLSGNVEAFGFIDDNKSLHGRSFAGIPVLGGSDSLTVLKEQGFHHFIVSVGIPKIRSLLFNRCLEAGLEPISAIHPRACVSNSAIIHAGSVVEAFSVIAVKAVVERGSFVTQNCSVSHDCVLQEFCHLAPGCHLGGSVNVGRGTLVGVGAAIAPHVDIGDHVIITPGTSIDGSVAKGSVVEGVPGRIIGKTSMVF